jgi:YggT family protein
LNIIYSLLSAAVFVIYFVNILIFVYVILSWIPQARDSKWGNILSMLLEPILSPVRKLLSKIEAIRNLPIDLSPIAAYFILSILQSLLSSIMTFFR